MTPRGSVARRDRLRLFCALRLPASVLDGLESWGARHLAERVVPPANLHVTVAFLGARPAAELEAILGAVAGAAAAAAPIELEPLRYRETRTVGMLVLADAGDAAARLAHRAFDTLERAGVYRREARPWLPHVTVVRFRRPPRLRPPLPEIGAFSPSDMAVYHSVLRSTGAQYEVVESFALGG